MKNLKKTYLHTSLVFPFVEDVPFCRGRASAGLAEGGAPDWSVGVAVFFFVNWFFVFLKKKVLFGHIHI